VAAISIRDLTYAYGPRTALSGVNFDVQPGEACGLLGPNGSGKSTLFRILSTLQRPQGGSATILGADVRTRPDDVRRQIGVVFQSPSIDRRLTVAENLRHQGHLYGLRGDALRLRIDELLGRLALADRRDDIAATLSGGQQRRVELAKGLLHRPRVLLLDEPSTGLDPAARIALREELARLRSEDEITILLTTHILDEADHCDRIVILDLGRIVEIGKPAELKGRIVGDCVVVHGADLDGLAARMRERLGVVPRKVDSSLRIESARGHELIARLVDAFGSEIESVTLARPTLEDVFIDRTGRRLDAEAA
jgi:ABC-2 type transport system ATP-binding protein